MARMLAKSTSRHAGHACRYAGRRGCTCYYYEPGALMKARRRAKFRAWERRRARAAENRSWRAALPN